MIIIGLRPHLLGAVFVLSVAVLIGPAALAQGDAKRGGDVFRLRCITCHAVACNRVGPLLRDIVGRKAGAVPDYPYYSEELKNSGIIWSEDVLDRMMAAPEKFLPGWGMQGAYLGKIDDPRQRGDITAFLNSGDTSLDICPR